ncbi:UDP-glucose 4-epimerase GalE [Gammaproteobacteria bacterium]|nr:UDP-glucose 4-epimerase GalE [Gammaproteobacteria bacterium]
MKILVTGATGYIGSHTIISLLSEGYSVVGIDNLSNSSNCSSVIEMISGVKFQFIYGDLNDNELLDNIFLKHKIDTVIHFAGLKAVNESLKKPLDYYHNNIVGTINLLRHMLKYKILNFIFSSSATVYGQDAVIPYVETMKPGKILSPYGQSKAMVERILSDVAVSNPNFRAVSLRYFNPIGAHKSGLIGEDPSNIPNNLVPYITQVAIGKREKLTIFGGDYPTEDGTCKRDYIHVLDLAEGHISALKWLKSNIDFTGVEVFNLGTGQTVSVLEIIQVFMMETGQIIKYEYGPKRKGDLPQFWANPKKAKKILGWESKLSLSDMLKDAWNWQLKNPNGFE